METHTRDFVPVVFADDVIEAEHYRSLLQADEIPTQVGDAAELNGTYTSLSRSIPVRVPQQYHDEATECVAAYEKAQAAGDVDLDDDTEDDLEDDDVDDDVDDDDEFDESDEDEEDEDDEEDDEEEDEDVDSEDDELDSDADTDHD